MGYTPVMTIEKVKSSRIIVKNLPKYTTDERLKSHFSTRGGQITDVKLMYTKSDRFRQFAYIGFSNDKEASEAVDYFNNTFIDTRKIQVETALASGDSRLERPWSRYSRGSSAFVSNQQALEAKAKRNREQEKIKEELRKKRQFLMEIFDKEDKDQSNFIRAASKKKSRTWENNNDNNNHDNHDNNMETNNPDAKKNNKPKISVSAVTSKKRGGDGILLSKTHVKFDGNDGNENDENDENGNHENNHSDDGNSEDLYEENSRKLSKGYYKPKNDHQEEMNNDNEKENHYHHNHNHHQSFSHSSSFGDNHDDRSKSNKFKENDKEKKRHSTLNPELIFETGKLFVRNLSYSCTEADLKSLFEPFGILTEIHMPVSSNTKTPKGFAHVLFMIPENAFGAYQKLDGTIFQGRLIHILPGEEKKEKEKEKEGESYPNKSSERGEGEKNAHSSSSSSFKSKKEKELKANSSNTFNWNSLFIRSDTVLEAISHRLGLSKAEIMNPDSEGNLAVKMALAETQIIQETKEYLESEGVILDQFKSNVERSDTIIMVKNLSFSTESSELYKLFSRFGNLGRVVLPPTTKAIALVEFLEPSEARMAFKSLAYTKFKNSPLFLEWAPVKVLSPINPTFASSLKKNEKSKRSIIKLEEKENEKSSSDNVDNSNNKGNEKNENCEKKEGKEEEEEEFHPSTNTLHVTNLNFSTKPATLKQIFSAFGQIRAVTIPATKKGGSLGFGFVEFDQSGAVNRALDKLQGVLVDDHKLILKRSKPFGSSSAESMKRSLKEKNAENVILEESEQSKTKIIVRNVPFEANLKELKELFRSFASVKKVRLPRKYDGHHRGFAFVEFISSRDAKLAMETLKHTHFYGRHLVLEWAKADVDDEVEQARTKAALVLTRSNKSNNTDSSFTKKGKIRIDDQLDDDDENDYNQKSNSDSD